MKIEKVVKNICEWAAEVSLVAAHGSCTIVLLNHRGGDSYYFTYLALWSLFSLTLSTKYFKGWAKRNGYEFLGYSGITVFLFLLDSIAVVGFCRIDSTWKSPVLALVVYGGYLLNYYSWLRASVRGIVFVLGRIFSKSETSK